MYPHTCSQYPHQLSSTASCSWATAVICSSLFASLILIVFVMQGLCVFSDSVNVAFTPPVLPVSQRTCWENWPCGQIRTAGPCTHASNRPRLKETSNRKQCFAFFQSFCKSKNIWDCMKGNKMCWKINKLVKSCQRDQLVYNYTFKNISNTQRYVYRLNEMSNVVFSFVCFKSQNLDGFG